MHTTCGTLNYIAPEIVKNTGYDGSLADIWACGVILYFMLTGQRPFDDESVHKLLDKIIVGDFKFPNDDQKKVSEEAKDLVKAILNPNPRKRLTIEQIRAHSWMQDDDLLSQNWSQSEIINNQIGDDISQQSYPPQGGGILSSPLSPLDRHPQLLVNHNVPHSDIVSFSTVCKPHVIQNRKMNCFEILNVLAGHSLSSMFEVRPKKKDLSLSSPFPKKKQSFRITAAGSLHRYYFFSREETT